MRTLRPFTWFISSILAGALAACSFVVQPIESYTTPDGFVRMEHPMDWRVEANWQESPFPIIALAGGEADLPSEMSAGMTIPPDSVALIFMLVPLPEAMVTEIAEYDDRAQTEFMHGFIDGMAEGFVGSLGLADSDSEISEPARVEIGRAQAVYESTVTLPEAELRMRAFLLDESFVVASMTATDLNGSAELQAQVDSVVRSLRLLATPEEIAAHYDAQQ